METGWPAINQPAGVTSRFLKKCINTEKDVIEFKAKSPAYRDILTYVNLLCDKIHSSGNKVLNRKYTLKDDRFQACAQLLDELASMCDETDLTQAKGSAPLRFGHIAFRGWFDEAKVRCRDFIFNQLVSGGGGGGKDDNNQQLKEELLSYLSDAFGNKMRIDYGTGHELSFIIFTMGLSHLYQGEEVSCTPDDGLNNNNHADSKSGPGPPSHPKESVISESKEQHLRNYVLAHGWDILALFTHNYLRLCRKFQTKFRLEPAGSRGVYNMDDFQYLPFLFGAAQLAGIKYIPTREFYLHDNVDMFKNDFMLLEAVDFILNNKRGPFHEHSYTLWCMADLGSWENIYRRIKAKFIDDVLGPFPIVQHLLFGKHILKWHDG